MSSALLSGIAVAHLELYVDGAWHRAGAVRVRDAQAGIRSPSTFEYDFDYLDRHIDAVGARDARAVTCRYPLGYQTFEEEHWPPFLLDVMPSGAARRHWEARLGLPETERADFSLLVAGAASSPGNIRVSAAVDPAAGLSNHPGFPRSDILDRAEGFIEYAHRAGAPISGSTGAGGDSPKFLLREDLHGRWHADGALPDERTRACWLVKFPRTRDRTDRLILEAEAGYHEVAARFGLRTHGTVTWERHCLFVPRFDRVVGAGGVHCLGLESLCSLAGVAEFGASIRKERLASSLAAVVDDPEKALRELVRRDILDVALGNTDNHARNTSVLKDQRGRVELAPIYDLAPMVLDKRGIARVCRWADGADLPDWNVVAAALVELGLEGARTRRWLRGLAEPVGELPRLMKECHVPRSVITQCEQRIAAVAGALGRVAR